MHLPLLRVSPAHHSLDTTGRKYEREKKGIEEIRLWRGGRRDGEGGRKKTEGPEGDRKIRDGGEEQNASCAVLDDSGKWPRDERCQCEIASVPSYSTFLRANDFLTYRKVQQEGDKEIIVRGSIVTGVCSLHCIYPTLRA